MTKPVDPSNDQPDIRAPVTSSENGLREPRPAAPQGLVWESSPPPEMTTPSDLGTSEDKRPRSGSPEPSPEETDLPPYDYAPSPLPPVQDVDTSIAQLNQKYSELFKREARLKEYCKKDQRFFHSREWVNLLNEYHQLDAEVGQLRDKGMVRALNPLQYSGMGCRRYEKFKDDVGKIIEDAQTDYLQKINALSRIYIDPIQHAYLTQEFADSPAAQEGAKAFQQEYKEQYEKIVNSLTDEIRALSAKYFLALPQEEMVNKDSEQCPNYKNITNFANFIGKYVQYSVLNIQDINARTYMMHFWISTAQKLFNTGDYSSAKMVIAAFYQPAIKRLVNIKLAKSINDGPLDFNLNFLKQELDSDDVKSHIDNRKKQNQSVIPYVGDYRTRLESAIELNQIAEIENLKNELIALQGLTRIEFAKSSEVQSTVERLFCEKSEEYSSKSFDETILQTSRIREPEDSPQIPSHIFSEIKFCPLDELKNRKLADFLFENNITFSVAANQPFIENINQFCENKDRDEDGFREILLESGLIDLTDDQKKLFENKIPELHLENLQHYYKSKITNKELFEVLKDKHLHAPAFGVSTAVTVEKLTGLYERLQQEAHTEGYQYGKNYAQFLAYLGHLEVVLTDQEKQALNLPVGNIDTWQDTQRQKYYKSFITDESLEKFANTRRLYNETLGSSTADSVKKLNETYNKLVQARESGSRDFIKLCYQFLRELSTLTPGIQHDTKSSLGIPTCIEIDDDRKPTVSDPEYLPSLKHYIADKCGTRVNDKDLKIRWDHVGLNRVVFAVEYKGRHYLPVVLFYTQGEAPTAYNPHRKVITNSRSKKDYEFVWVRNYKADASSTAQVDRRSETQALINEYAHIRDGWSKLTSIDHGDLPSVVEHEQDWSARAIKYVEDPTIKNLLTNCPSHGIEVAIQNIKEKLGRHPVNLAEILRDFAVLRLRTEVNYALSCNQANAIKTNFLQVKEFLKQEIWYILDDEDDTSSQTILDKLKLLILKTRDYGDGSRPDNAIDECIQLFWADFLCKLTVNEPAQPDEADEELSSEGEDQFDEKSEIQDLIKEYSSIRVERSKLTSIDHGDWPAVLAHEQDWYARAKYYTDDENIYSLLSDCTTNQLNIKIESILKKMSEKNLESCGLALREFAILQSRQDVHWILKQDQSNKIKTRIQRLEKILNARMRHYVVQELNMGGVLISDSLKLTILKSLECGEGCRPEDSVDQYIIGFWGDIIQSLGHENKQKLLNFLSGEDAPSEAEKTTATVSAFHQISALLSMLRSAKQTTTARSRVPAGSEEEVSSLNRPSESRTEEKPKQAASSPFLFVKFMALLASLKNNHPYQPLVEKLHDNGHETEIDEAINDAEREELPSSDNTNPVVSDHEPSVFQSNPTSNRTVEAESVSETSSVAMPEPKDIFKALSDYVFRTVYRIVPEKTVEIVQDNNSFTTNNSDAPGYIRVGEPVVGRAPNVSSRDIEFGEFRLDGEDNKDANLVAFLIALPKRVEQEATLSLAVKVRYDLDPSLLAELRSGRYQTELQRLNAELSRLGLHSNVTIQNFPLKVQGPGFFARINKALNPSRDPKKPTMTPAINT